MTSSLTNTTGSTSTPHLRCGDARGLRHVLTRMRDKARQGESRECELLRDVAVDARQNLERSFRIRLGLDPLQKRNDLGEFDKLEK